MSVMRKRLARRRNDISDAIVDLLKNQQATTEDFTRTERDLVTTVDTSQANWQVAIANIW